jgi:hypothetical protein
MNRQQRTNYMRQRATTVSPEALFGLLWTIAAADATTITLHIVGMRDGLVINGFPAIHAVNSGRDAISAVLAVSPDPTLYDVLIVTFDGPLDDADLYELTQPSQSVRNRWGGTLSAAVQAYPTPFVINDEIALQFVSASTHQLDVEFVALFLPVCIGPNFTITNDNTSEPGVFLGWSGVQASFYFSLGLTPGDVVSWPGDQPACKAQYGGSLIADSLVIL